MSGAGRGRIDSAGVNNTTRGSRAGRPARRRRIFPPFRAISPFHSHAPIMDAARPALSRPIGSALIGHSAIRATRTAARRSKSITLRRNVIGERSVPSGGGKEKHGRFLVPGRGSIAGLTAPSPGDRSITSPSDATRSGPLQSVVYANRRRQFACAGSAIAPSNRERLVLHRDAGDRRKPTSPFASRTAAAGRRCLTSENKELSAIVRRTVLRTRAGGYLYASGNNKRAHRQTDGEGKQR